MVDIKGLDKERVAEALNREAKRSVETGGMFKRYWEGEISYDRLCRRVTVDLNGDEFDERMYDKAFGEGTAQRAVDSVRAEQKTGPDPAGNAGGEKKELSMDEKLKQTKEAIEKILSILTELPPDMCAIASTCLKMMLPGKGIMRMPFSPPFPFESWF